MPTPSLLDDDGRLHPFWPFLTFHHALRRDATRLRAALPTLADHPERLAGFRAHWHNYRLLLEWHHEAEDDNLFPLLRRRATHLHPLLDRLDAEHATLHHLLPTLTAAIAGLPEPEAATRTGALLHQLDDMLEPHLSAEEDHLLPELTAWIAEQPDPTPPDDGEAPTDAGPVPDAFTYPWTLEGLDPRVTQLAVAALPPPLQAAYPQWRRTYDQHLATWTA